MTHSAAAISIEPVNLWLRKTSSHWERELGIAIYAGGEFLGIWHAAGRQLRRTGDTEVVAVSDRDEPGPMNIWIMPDGPAYHVGTYLGS